MLKTIGFSFNVSRRKAIGLFTRTFVWMVAGRQAESFLQPINLPGAMP